MVATKDAKAAELLLQYLETITLPTGVLIANMGQSFTPTPDKSFIRWQLFYNPPLQVTIGYTQEPIRQGLLQVSAYSSQSQKLSEVTELAVTVADHFARGTKLGDDDFLVRISGDPQLSGPLQEETRLQVPVTVPWQAFS